MITFFAVPTHNRLFDGRRVIADFFDETKHKNGIYGEQSGCNNGVEGKNGEAAGCDEATEGAGDALQESMAKAVEDSNLPNLDCGRGNDDDTN